MRSVPLFYPENKSQTLVWITWDPVQSFLQWEWAGTPGDLLSPFPCELFSELPLDKLSSICAMILSLATGKLSYKPHVRQGLGKP